MANSEKFADQLVRVIRARQAYDTARAEVLKTDPDHTLPITIRKYSEAKAELQAAAQLLGEGEPL